MKRFIRNNIKTLMILLVGIIVGGTTVFASTFLANDVSYTPQDNTFNVKNVGSALDKLYEMNLVSDTIDKTQCIHGSFNCDSNCTGSNGLLIEDEFEPSIAIVHTLDSRNVTTFIYDISDKNNIKYYQLGGRTVNSIAFSTYFKVKNGAFYAHDFGASNNGIVWDYYVCK